MHAVVYLCAYERYDNFRTSCAATYRRQNISHFIVDRSKYSSVPDKKKKNTEYAQMLKNTNEIKTKKKSALLRYPYGGGAHMVVVVV